MNSKHLTSKKIKDFLSENLPTDEQIDVGIHLDKCRKCFTKAGDIYKGIKVIEDEIDSMANLPKMIEEFEKAKKEHLQQIDKNSAISVIKKMLNRADEVMRNMLEELLTKLLNPAYQLTPLSTLINNANLTSDLKKTLSETVEIKKRAASVLPEKRIQLLPHNKNHIECRVETKGNELPTIFTPSVKNGIEILPFSKIEGTNFFSALIPQKVVDKHYVVHKSKSTKR